MEKPFEEYEHAPIDLLTDDSINSIAHDLKTPLTIMKGFTQLIIEKKAMQGHELQDNELRHYLQIIDQNSKRMNDAILNTVGVLKSMKKPIGGKPELVGKLMNPGRYENEKQNNGC